MHGPHHGLPTTQDLPDTTQREHALIDPVQMDDVCLLKLTQTGDVRPRIGDVDFEKMLTRMHSQKDAEPLPKKVPSLMR